MSRHVTPIAAKLYAQRAGLEARGGDGASVLSPRYVTPGYAALLADVAAGIDQGMARVAERPKSQASALCAAKEGTTPQVIGGAQSPHQQKRASKRDLRHVMTTIAERKRKYAAETGFDMVTREMTDPPMEQWDRPEAMPLYWRLMVAGDSTPPLSSLSPGDQELARWMHGEELLTIVGDSIACLSDARDVEQCRYPGSPLPDPCTKVDGKCTFHVSGPCPKIAHAGGPYHAAIGKYLGPKRSARLLRDAWSAIRTGQPYAQIASGQRREMTRKAGIRVSTREICRQANVRLAQLKVMHPGEWADYRYMSTDVCERTVKTLLDSGEAVEAEPSRMTRIGHTEAGVPRTYAATSEEMSGWTAYAKPRPARRSLRKAA